MRIEIDGIRRWLIAENKEDAVFVDNIYKYGRGWIAYSSDGYSHYGAIAFDFPDNEKSPSYKPLP